MADLVVKGLPSFGPLSRQANLCKDRAASSALGLRKEQLSFPAYQGGDPSAGITPNARYFSQVWPASTTA